MKAINKFYVCIIVALVAVTLTGCQNVTSGNTDNIATKRIAPKMGLVAKASRAVANSNDFVLENNFNIEHRLDIPYSQWDAMQIQLASPVFDGFEYVNFENGSTYESTAYGRKLTTTVVVNDTGSIFSGTYNDGGGYYTLSIGNDGKYTFTQYLIFDVIFLYDGAWDTNNYIGEVRRFVTYSNSSGTITVAVDGTLTSEGTGSQIRVEFIPGTSGPGTIAHSPTDLEVGMGDFWCTSNGYVTDFETKSSPGYFVMRNSGAYRFELWASLDQTLFASDMRDVTYNNTSIIDKAKTITSISKISEKPYYYQYVTNNYVCYKLNGTWSVLYNMNIMPWLVVANEQSVLDGWWNYTVPAKSTTGQ